MSQIDRVRKALLAGSRTSTEISLLTKLPQKHCTALLRELVARGLAVKTDRKIGQADFYLPVEVAGATRCG